MRGVARADPPTASCAARCVRGRHTSSPCEKLSVPVRDTSFQSEGERERAGRDLLEGKVGERCG